MNSATQRIWLGSLTCTDGIIQFVSRIQAIFPPNVSLYWQTVNGRGLFLQSHVPGQARGLPQPYLAPAQLFKRAPRRARVRHGDGLVPPSPRVRKNAS